MTNVDPKLWAAAFRLVPSGGPDPRYISPEGDLVLSEDEALKVLDPDQDARGEPPQDDEEQDA